MKNKKLRIVLDILLIALGVVFLISGIKDFKDFSKQSKVTDEARFHKSYSYVKEKESIYKYISLKDLDKLLDEKNNIILIGTPSDAYTQTIVKPLNDIVKSKYDKIYYLENNKLDKDSKVYKNILKKLKIEAIENPSIILTNKVKILSKDDLYEKEYTGVLNEYWTNARVQELIKKLGLN